MKKTSRLVAIFLVSAMVLSFVACDKKSNGDDTGHTRSDHIESQSSSIETTGVNSSSNQKWNLGTLTKTGLDNGYSGDKKIDNSDPHHGAAWTTQKAGFWKSYAWLSS